jgi:hypothetical protein
MTQPLIRQGDKINLAHLRERAPQYITEWGEITSEPSDPTSEPFIAITVEERDALIDAVEAAHRVTIALDSPHPNIAIIGCRLELDASLSQFHFGDAQ